jgi:hypothetical protein
MLLEAGIPVDHQFSQFYDDLLQRLVPVTLLCVILFAKPPLHLNEGDRLSVIKFLLENGANPNVQNPIGDGFFKNEPAILYCARCDGPEMVRPFHKYMKLRFLKIETGRRLGDSGTILPSKRSQMSCWRLEILLLNQAMSVQIKLHNRSALSPKLS